MAGKGGSIRVHTEQGDEPIVVSEGPSAAPIPPEPEQQAVLAEASADQAETATPEPETISAKRGKAFATYTGSADVVEAVDDSADPPKTYRFEPGVPVEVPKGFAEVLLTTPYEEWRVTDEVPAPPPEVEE